MPADSQATSPSARRIENRMEDCGNGRHVGWWSELDGLGDQHLSIEVNSGIVSFACCEGSRAERRISFYTNKETAGAIAAALSKALAGRLPKRDCEKCGGTGKVSEP